jgi:hypothetical protein
MEVVQKGGTLLETEEAFFEWLNKDSNIEDLLKSTLAFLDYKKQTANKLVKETYKELDAFWATNVVSRVKTQQAVTKSFDDAMAKQDKRSLDYPEIYATGLNIEKGTKSVEAETTLVNKLVSGINQTQQLNTLYEKQRVYICQTYFAKKSKPEEFKKALAMKRASIRAVVNQFIESFTGDSNRRHRLYILNYAIDFAQNWTSFQDNYKLNLIITGGAGLGKTTFAKAIGRIFFEFGLLARDFFQIREKTDFIGQYVGQTPTKTYPILYGALESMLFIDEAYSVSGCQTGASYDYGQEFIDALVDVTQKTRGLISVVAAGYKSEMHNCFLDKNPGMRRRFPNEIELVPYSIIDLDNILTNNVLRPIFPGQLNTIFKLDLLKEPEIYFQKASKFTEFGKEILQRLPEIDPTHSMDAAIYTNLASNENRASALVTIASNKITDYKTIIRFRTKIIGLYRFFLQLASFDTNYPSFESMYAAHQYLWNRFTGGDGNRTYKYNNYRLMHILYLSSQQQKREILKSFLLRNYFSEKEGSLFPNQAGDMDTLAGFIKSQPNIRENTLPTLEEVVKLFNEYFRSRGGSKFLLRATKQAEKIDLFIYHIGGGFTTYTDFEGTVLTKIFKSLTYDNEDVSALWKLNSIPPDQRTKIIQNINKLYSQACISLLKEAKESLKTDDSKEKNEKRLPSGIDIRFLEAEANSYMSANESAELGDPDKMKYLEYVSLGELEEDEGQISAILKEITRETDTNIPPISLTLNAGLYCPEIKLTQAAPAEPPPPPPPAPPAPKKPTSTAATAALAAATAAGVTVPTLSATRTDPEPSLSLTTIGTSTLFYDDGADQANVPPMTIRFTIQKGKISPKSLAALSNKALDTEKKWVIVSLLPSVELPAATKSKAGGYAMFYLKWSAKPQVKYVYVMARTHFCDTEIYYFRTATTNLRVFILNYVGTIEELYPRVPMPITFTKGRVAPPPPPVPGPVAPPPPPSGPTDPEITEEMKAEARKQLAAIYPPNDTEVMILASEFNADKKTKFLTKYKQIKIMKYIQEKSIDLDKPEHLYYKGKRSTITSFNDLVEKKLALNETESWSLHAAEIVDAPDIYVTTQKEETGEDVHLRIFGVKYLEPELGMGANAQYYGLVLPKANATIEEMPTTPWKFILTESTEEEEENEAEVELVEASQD